MEFSEFMAFMAFIMIMVFIMALCQIMLNYLNGDDANKTETAVLIAHNNTLKKQIEILQQIKPNAIYIKSESIDKDMLKLLISLCHPDKHNNNMMSTKATQWLLQQKKC